jgi:hypothetical protein
MPKRYAREFRPAICERLVAGERISKISSETVSPRRPSILGRTSGGPLRWPDKLAL